MAQNKTQFQLIFNFSLHLHVLVASPPSDDDERAECPSGTACEKRPNPRHRSVFKHVTVTGPVAERPQGPGYDITDPPSEDDERVECPEGTSCRIRSSTLHRGKYKHTVTYESDYELPEEAGDDESKGTAVLNGFRHC